jgi:O-acetyl-ADP-ribose deacetylase (regulator of RNase III)
VKKIEQIAAVVNEQRGHINPLSLPIISTQYRGNYSAADHTCIWVGDITQLSADAIVNAANTEMLGCRLPNHACIDNAIHSAAGPRLRNDCATIIDCQQAHEQVAQAKITRGYALPARYVLHTVGPQLRPKANPTTLERQQLANAYNSCLNIAAQVDAIRTIAFCAISTGVFSFPKKEAAEIALTTVAQWIKDNPQRFDRIVFNLYSHADALVYENILNTYEGRDK